MNRRRALAMLPALALLPGLAHAQLVNPGAPTLAERDGLIGPSFDIDVQAWAAAVAANGGSVSAARAALITSLVSTWKAAGAWALVDDAWLLVAENQPQALTSLKQRRLAVAVTAPTFAADAGYAFNGTTQYIDTFFTPSAHAVAMTGTNMHIAVYERTNVSAGGVAAGCFNFSSQGISINPRNGAGCLGLSLNSQTIGPGGDAIADSRGLSMGSRNGPLAADVLAYKNGVAVVPYAPGTVSAVLPTQSILIGAQMNNTPAPVNFRAATEGFVSVGAAIPLGQQAAFYTALQSFMTAVGANV